MRDEIVVMLSPGVPAETIEYLAQISATRVYLTQARDSLASIAREQYGDAGPWAAALAKLNSKLAPSEPGQPLTRWSILDPGVEVQLPDLERRGPVRAVVPGGSSVAKVAAAFYPTVGTRTMAMIAAANPGIDLERIVADTPVVLPWPRSIERVRLRPGIAPVTALAQLSRMPGVELATVNGVAARIEDSVVVDRNALSRTATGYDPARLNDNWFVTIAGADKIVDEDMNLKSPVVVAILDSGLDFSHPDFVNNLWSDSASAEGEDAEATFGFDFANRRGRPDDTLENSHGTHVAGIASARVLGGWSSAFARSRLDQFIKLMILRVADDRGAVTLEAIMSSLEYAQARGARIVSGSWTTVNSPPLRDYMTRYSGLLTIVAAGNGEWRQIEGHQVRVGYNVDDRETFPGSFRLPHMLTIGAIGPDRSIAFFSNFGSRTVHVLAPGVEVRSTLRTSTGEAAYGRMSGTSQATPFVTLAAAILMAKNNLLTAQAVKQRILDSSDFAGVESHLALAGRLNLLKTISIDQDIVELTNGSVLRGVIKNPSIKFAPSQAQCSTTTALDRRRDRIARVVVQSDSQPAVAIIAGQRQTGWVCDPSVTVATANGLVTTPIARVADIVWRGVRGRP
jgi:subtilisin family serine protease